MRKRARAIRVEQFETSWWLVSGVIDATPALRVESLSATLIEALYEWFSLVASGRYEVVATRTNGVVQATLRLRPVDSGESTQ